MATAQAFKNTPEGKGIRTFYQTFIAALPTIVAVLSIIFGTPEVAKAASGAIPWTATLLPVFAGVVAYLQNKAGK